MNVLSERTLLQAPHVVAVNMLFSVFCYGPSIRYKASMDVGRVGGSIRLQLVVKNALIHAALAEADPLRFLAEARGELINALVLGVGSSDTTTEKELRAEIVEAVRKVWPEVIGHFERPADLG